MRPQFNGNFFLIVCLYTRMRRFITSLTGSYRIVCCLLAGMLLSSCTPSPKGKPSGGQAEAAAAFVDVVTEAELEAIGVELERFEHGYELYQQYCTACHMIEVSADAHPDPGSMLAPPAFAVAHHYRRAYDEPQARIDAIVEYVRTPSESRAQMPGAVRRFGPMAPMPLPEEKLRDLAIFLSTGSFKQPPWYGGHYRQEHGVQP